MILAFLLIIPLAYYVNAQSTPAADTSNVSGKVVSLKGPELIVASPSGDVKIAVAEKTVIRTEVPIKFSEITPNMYVGATATKQPDGNFLASQINIFSEDQRGTGEGHRPLGAATMTNANVDTSVAAVDGQMLTLKYKDGEKKLLVTPKTVIVAYAPGDRAELKPGIKFFAVAQKQPDGSLQAARISYGRDGLTPPM